MIGLATMSTCADACWFAREDVCRCSCGGAQHGILLEKPTATPSLIPQMNNTTPMFGETGEQPAPAQPTERPKRTRRAGNNWYELNAVIEGYGAAHRYASDNLDMKGFGGKGREQWIESVPNRLFGKWHELEGFQPTRSFQEHPHFVWLRLAGPPLR